jgi:hypothetical protein
MIRRDVRLADGADAWMLISQVEHARISAELASHCPRIADATHASSAVRDETLAAIRHHDDGWTAWELEPGLDPQLGRPLSFTELELHEALPIWTRSIDAAAAIGPLAAWMVAGHFLRLAAKSDEAQADGGFGRWRDEIDERRRGWLGAWSRVDPLRHTNNLAAEALQWLWTFDEASLWLCCSSSSADRQIPCAPQPYRAGRGTPIEMELRALGPELAAAQPWRFDVAELSVSGVGRVVPIRRYRSPAELLAAAAPQEFHWRLISGENRGETPAKPRS